MKMSIESIIDEMEKTWKMVKKGCFDNLDDDKLQLAKLTFENGFLRARLDVILSAKRRNSEEG